MPILTLQKRLPEAGRLRMGETRVSKQGKEYPASLLTWRITSADKDKIMQVAELYGGQVRPWTAPGEREQFEVITDRNKLPITIPHMGAFSQWYELFSAGGMLRQCNGQIEMKTSQPCICITEMEDAEAKGKEPERACKATTRFSVFLSEVADLGVWRVESHGEIAAGEMGGQAEILTRANVFMIPASLRIEKRELKRRKPNGEVEVFHIVVPVIGDLPSIKDLMAGIEMVSKETGEIIRMIPKELESPGRRSGVAEDNPLSSPTSGPPVERSRTRVKLDKDRMREEQDAAMQTRQGVDASVSKPAVSSETSGSEIGSTDLGEGDAAGADPAAQPEREVSDPASSESVISMEKLCEELNIKPQNRAWLFLLNECKPDFDDLKTIKAFRELTGERARTAEIMLRRQFEVVDE